MFITDIVISVTAKASIGDCFQDTVKRLQFWSYALVEFDHAEVIQGSFLSYDFYFTDIRPCEIWFFYREQYGIDLLTWKQYIRLWGAFIKIESLIERYY